MKMFTDGRMDRRMDGPTDDRCQAHPYIPRTFRLGDKNVFCFFKCSPVILEAWL